MIVHLHHVIGINPNTGGRGTSHENAYNTVYQRLRRPCVDGIVNGSP